MGTAAWEAARIADGLPVSGAELTPDYNPLEAGLCDCVSLTKGCTLGAEALSKVAAAGRLKRALWGLRLAPGDGVAPGDAVTAGEEGARIGAVTSATPGSPGAPALALCYISPGRAAAAGIANLRDGLVVACGGKRAALWTPPRVVRDLPSLGRGGAGDAAPTPSAAAAAPDDTGASAAAAREAKLAAMKARLEAWQAAQGGGEGEGGG